jgi:hypothetical protein
MLVCKVERQRTRKHTNDIEELWRNVLSLVKGFAQSFIWCFYSNMNWVSSVSVLQKVKKTHWLLYAQEWGENIPLYNWGLKWSHRLIPGSQMNKYGAPAAWHFTESDQSTRRETRLVATLSITNPTLIILGLNSDLHGNKSLKVITYPPKWLLCPDDGGKTYLSTIKLRVTSQMPTD